VDAHTLAHTRARALSHSLPDARSGGHVSLARPRRAHTPHPSRAPRPRATPPIPHPPKAIGQKGGAAPGERAAKTTLPVARRRCRGAAGGRGARGGPGRPADQGGARSPRSPAPEGGRPAAAGSRAGRGNDRRARCYSLARPAGGRAWGRPRRAPRSCSRRHAWLPGRLCRRRRNGRCGPAADLYLGGDLFSPLPPGAPPPLLLSLHFLDSSPLPRLLLVPEPRTHVPTALPRRPVPAMSLLFWDRSVYWQRCSHTASSLPRRRVVPSPAACSPTGAPAWRLGRGPERGAAALEESGVATGGWLWESGAPGGTHHWQVRRDPTHVPRKRLNLEHCFHSTPSLYLCGKPHRGLRWAYVSRKATLVLLNGPPEVSM
jgi:hypothetical protein